jgi:hypothetical protein
MSAAAAAMTNLRVRVFPSEFFPGFMSHFQKRAQASPDTYRITEDERLGEESAIATPCLPGRKDTQPCVPFSPAAYKPVCRAAASSKSQKRPVSTAYPAG